MSSSQKFVVAGFDITPLDEKLKKIGSFLTFGERFDLIHSWTDCQSSDLIHQYLPQVLSTLALQKELFLLGFYFSNHGCHAFALFSVFLCLFIFSEFLHKLSTQTGLPEVYLVGGVVGVVLSVLLLSFGLSAVMYVIFEIVFSFQFLIGWNSLLALVCVETLSKNSNFAWQ